MTAAATVGYTQLVEFLERRLSICVNIGIWKLDRHRAHQRYTTLGHKSNTNVRVGCKVTPGLQQLCRAIICRLSLNLISTLLSGFKNTLIRSLELSK